MDEEESNMTVETSGQAESLLDCFKGNEEELERFVEYDKNTKCLLDYFNSANIDIAQLQTMLKLYDRLFYEVNYTFMNNKRYPRYNEIFDRFREIGVKISKFLTTVDKSSNEQLGQRLLQQVFKDNVIILKHPSLLQYFFYIQCEKNKIPYQPIKSFFSMVNGAFTDVNNVVFIKKQLGSGLTDVVEKNIFTLFAIMHELEHIKHRLANPNGNAQERLFNLLSRIQSLEDGYENGSPSHHIGYHTEFPDEVFADVGACKNLLDELKQNYNSSPENMEKIKKFLKSLSDKLLIKNTKDEGRLPTPTQYFEQFVETRVENSAELTSSEKVRAEVFVQDYLEYVKTDETGFKQ